MKNSSAAPSSRLTSAFTLTIDKRNVITMYAKCYNMIGKPIAAYLHFSREDDTIAIEPVSSAMLPGVFPFRANGTARYLNAASFCRHFGISLDTTLRFICPELRDGALHLKLSETVAVARRRKWQRKPKQRPIETFDESQLAQII